MKQKLFQKDWIISAYKIWKRIPDKREYSHSTGQNNDLKQENLESSPYGQEWMNAL